MTTRYMPYDEHDFRFIMANLFHDVIHDYGPSASDERWEKVQQQLTQFDKNRYTIFVGGVRARTHSSKHTYNTKKHYTKNNFINRKTQVTKSTNQNIFANTVNALKRKYSAEYDADITSYLVSEFAESVNTKICFNAFAVSAYRIKYGERSITFSDLFNPDESDEFTTIPIHNNIHTSSNDETSSLNELYNQISYYVRYSYLLNNTNNVLDVKSIVNQFIDLDPVATNNIFARLHNYILVSIYDTAQTDDSQSVTSMRGGAKTVNSDLDIETVAQLITELTAERDRFITDEIENVYMKFSAKSNEYDIQRRFALIRIKEILQKYGQLNKSGTMDNASSCINKCCFLPPIPKSDRRSNKTLDEFKNECFLTFYNTSLIEYYTTIQNGFKVEEETIRLRQERDIIRAQSGQLTMEQKYIRDQFCSLIAKIGLVLNNEYNVDGTQNKNAGIIPENDANLTSKEMNMLANWANWEWTHATTQSTGVRSNIDAELFNTTYHHFKQHRMDIDQYPICKGTPYLRYVIDNAAMVPNALKNYIFCTASSVVDGMKKCNSTQLEEYGNMNFLLCSKPQHDAKSFTHYYNGRSIYNSATKTAEYVIELKSPLLSKPFTLNKQIPLTGTGLEAHNVLRVTLVSTLQFLSWLNDTYPDIANRVYANTNGIFNGLYECIFNDLSQINEKFNTDLPTIQIDFITALLHILFKGSGDLFQEINAVCKWGGYSDMSSYSCSSYVNSYDSTNNMSDGNGNTLRMLIANDQPSGCRFAFLLLKGYNEFINEYAFGGYMGLGKSLLVTRVDIKSSFRDKICKPNMNRGGRFTKRTKRFSRKKTYCDSNRINND